MKLVKVKQDFFDLCEMNNVADQLMQTKSGRPCVLIVRLKYKGKNKDFIVPLRSNIPAYADEWEYKSLPPNKNTRPGSHHGIHYIKLFPIKKKYIDNYLINNNPYLLTIKNIIDKSEKEIIDACQDYLDKYSAGNKHRFSPDIDGIINLLENEN